MVSSDHAVVTTEVLQEQLAVDSLLAQELDDAFYSRDDRHCLIVYAHIGLYGMSTNACNNRTGNGAQGSRLRSGSLWLQDSAVPIWRIIGPSVLLSVYCTNIFHHSWPKLQYLQQQQQQQHHNYHHHHHRHTQLLPPPYDHNTCGRLLLKTYQSQLFIVPKCTMA